MMTLTILLAASIPIYCDGDITAAITKAVGADVELSAGACSVSSPIVVDKPMRITGAGEGRTSIQAQRGAFGATARLSLADLKIWRADFVTQTSTRAIGVNANAAIDLDRVRIEGFTVGVLIHASALEFGTNANGWRLSQVTVMGSAHAGVIVRGRDSNAGLGQAVRVHTSCERGTRWVDTLGPCAAIVDRSFLGNTWIAPHTASTYEIINGEAYEFASVYSMGASQHSVWVGTYCERDQGPAVIDAGAIMIGGICTRVNGTGLRIDGTQFSGIEIRNAKDPRNVVTFRAGNRAASGTFYELVADAIDKSRPLRAKAEVRGGASAQLADKCYIQDIANQTEVARVCQDGSRK